MNGGAGWTTGALAQRLGAVLVGRADLLLRRIEPLDRAGADAVTFIRSAKFAGQWAKSAAAAAIVTRGVEPAGHDPARRALLVVEDADEAVSTVLEALTPAHAAPSGVHPRATVDPTAALGAGVAVGPGACVGAGARVGEGTILHANVVLGAGVVVGSGCDLRAGVVIEDRCVVGDRVTIHPSAVIGADGFGYRPAPGGRGLVKIPHAGNVEIGDDVEIGAGTTIDRGKFGATTIGAGTKIDNLVQIGHNCRIGRCCVICGAAAMAGSVTVGDGAMIGGGAGIADGVTIGAGTRLGAQSGVMKDIPPDETYAGVPAMPIRETLRVFAALRHLPELVRRMSHDDHDVAEVTVSQTLTRRESHEARGVGPGAARGEGKGG